MLSRLSVAVISRKWHLAIPRKAYGAKIAVEPGCGMCKMLRGLAEDPEVVFSGGATQFATEAMNQNSQTSPYEGCFTFASFPVSALRRLSVVGISLKRYLAIHPTTCGAKIVAEPNCGVSKTLRGLAEDPEVVLSGSATQFATEAMNQNGQTSPWNAALRSLQLHKIRQLVIF